MDAETDTCSACGSRRVVSGTLRGFVLSEAKNRRWLSFFSHPYFKPAPVINICQHGNAVLCLNCGTVNAVLTADVKRAKKVVRAWGTEDLKSRLDISEESL